jgi:hypothetical protein
MNLAIRTKSRRGARDARVGVHANDGFPWCSMPRGSKPGERRGGRQRATPNRRTVLRDRILAVAPAKPTATFREFVPILVGDQALPDDIRITIARKVPAETRSKTANERARKTLATKAQSAERNTHPKSDKGVAKFAPLDLLISIVRDEATTEAGRRRAASEIAEFFLPRIHGPKRIRFPADEFGFSVDPQLAKEFRDIRWNIACSAIKGKKLPPDTFAMKVAKLQARLKEIRQVLQPPDPSKYTKQATKLDEERLEILSRQRATNAIFSPEEDMEEAHRMARLASFHAGPEAVARSRLDELHQKHMACKRGGGLQLTRLEADTYRFLATFYPPDPAPISLHELYESHPELLESHPFNLGS